MQISIEIFNLKSLIFNFALNDHCYKILSIKEKSRHLVSTFFEKVWSKDKEPLYIKYTLEKSSNVPKISTSLLVPGIKN